MLYKIFWPLKFSAHHLTLVVRNSEIEVKHEYFSVFRLLSNPKLGNVKILLCKARRILERKLWKARRKQGSPLVLSVIYISVPSLFFQLENGTPFIRSSQSLFLVRLYHVTNSWTAYLLCSQMCIYKITCICAWTPTYIHIHTYKHMHMHIYI